jgi:hypothetical protein
VIHGFDTLASIRYSAQVAAQPWVHLDYSTDPRLGQM